MKKSRFALSTLARVLLAAPLALIAAGAASAAPTADEPSYACWVSGDTGKSVCVDQGEDLVLAVAEQAGTELLVPAHTLIGGVAVSSSERSIAANGIITPFAEVVISILYDDVNYGGGSFVMSYNNANCATTAYGYAQLGPYGWNDRASSFRSYAGCITAVFENINYGGASVGYQTNASSLGVMNDAASSWRVQ